MTLRYVVLHHTGIESPHFDLLYESEQRSALTSFRCPHWPARVGDAWDERPDHRRDYLSFEGEISGGRGHVRRVDAGAIEAVDLTTDPVAFGVTLRSDVTKQSGSLVLTHEMSLDYPSNTTWRITQSASVL